MPSSDLSLDKIEDEMRQDSFDDKVQEVFNLIILINQLADSSQLAAERSRACFEGSIHYP